MMDKNELAGAWLAAAHDPTKWESALELLAKQLNAKAAIITLRSAKTGLVEVTEEMERDLHTPFVSGLSSQAVDYYVNNLRETDVWALAQSVRRPHVPTVMSTHPDVKNFQGSDLQKWLTSQKINDTIVVEIGYSRKYWTALNIFFHAEEVSVANVVRDQLLSLMPMIKQAWTLGRMAHEYACLRKQVIQQVGSSVRSLFLIDEGNFVLAHSPSAAELVRREIAQISADKKRLILPENMNFPDDGAKELVSLSSALGSAEIYEVKISNSSVKTAIGENIGLQIVQVEPVDHYKVVPWENPKLDQRERQLILMVAEGKNIKSAEKVFGLKERQVRNIWKSARKKLGGFSKKADLVEIYRKSNYSVQERQQTT